MEDRSNLDRDIAVTGCAMKCCRSSGKAFPRRYRASAGRAILSGWRDLQTQISCMFPLRNSEGRSDLPSDALATLALWNMAGRPRKGYEELCKVVRWLRAGGTGEHILPGEEAYRRERHYQHGEERHREVLMGAEYDILIDARRIQQAVSELGGELSELYSGEEVVVIPLLREPSFRCGPDTGNEPSVRVEFIGAASYGAEPYPQER